jgi:hypothetical protein
VASLIGGVGGMMLNPIPGAGAKALVEAAGAAKLAKALEVAPTLVSRVGTGALIGGGTEAIRSKADIGSKEYFKDIGKGMGMGGAFGVGEEYLGRTGTWAKEEIAKSPKIQRIIRAFQLSKGTPFEMNPEGEPIKLTEELTREGGGPSKILKQLDYVKRELATSFKRMYDVAKEDFNDFFRVNGKTVLNSDQPEISNIINVLNQHKSDLSKAIGSGEINKLTNLNAVIDPASGVLASKNYQGTVSDLYDLRRALLDNVGSDKIKQLDRDTFTSLYGGKDKKGLVNEIDELLSNMFPDSTKQGIKGYSTLKNNIDKAASPLEKLINKTADEEAISLRLSDLSDNKSNQTVQNALDRILKRMGPAFGDAEQRNAFNQMVDTYEDVLSHMYQNSPKFQDYVKKGARTLKLKEPLTPDFKGSKEEINAALGAARDKLLNQEKAIEVLKKNIPAGPELDRAIQDF